MVDTKKWEGKLSTYAENARAGANVAYGLFAIAESISEVAAAITGSHSEVVQIKRGTSSDWVNYEGNR